MPDQPPDHQPERVTLCWENINVYSPADKKTAKRQVEPESIGSTSSKTKTERMQILNNVTGVAEPGTLLAVIGASGSGKSTLMNVLSDRNLKEYKVDGVVKVNGLVVKRGIRNISAYVQQDELFIGTLTVRETLTFRALLRMDNRIKKEARLHRVEEVIKEMGLSKRSNTRIGNTGAKRGISGGELRRLSFACETLMNPPLLFCDEPTSGLDSFMARKVVRTLQEMATKNRTVVCVIHQPSSEIFAMFDRILLMAEGRVAFMGTPPQAMEFFSSLNYTCPTNFNPSDFYVMTLAIEPGNETQCSNNVNAICDAYKDSTYASENEQAVNVSVFATGSSVVMEHAFSSESRYEASWGRQFTTVLWRSWVSMFRNVHLFQVRAAQSVGFAILLGLIYLRQDYDQKGVMNINGALFIIVINASFTSALAIINSFPHELGVFLREYGTGLYQTDVYFLAKDLAELPTFLLLPFIYVSIVYWMIGLNDGLQNFFIAAAVCVLVGNVAVSLGLLVSTLAGDVSVALSLVVPIMIPMVLFGGFFLNTDSVPVYFVWLEHMSWFKYSVEILTVNQWDGITSIDCHTNITQLCQYSSGEDVLRYLSFSKENQWLNVGALFVLLIVFRAISFLGLLVRARRSRT